MVWFRGVSVGTEGGGEAAGREPCRGVASASSGVTGTCGTDGGTDGRGGATSGVTGTSIADALSALCAGGGLVRLAMSGESSEVSYHAFSRLFRAAAASVDPSAMETTLNCLGKAAESTGRLPVLEWTTLSASLAALSGESVNLGGWGGGGHRGAASRGTGGGGGGATSPSSRSMLRASNVKCPADETCLRRSKLPKRAGESS